jgi:cell division protein ZapA
MALVTFKVHNNSHTIACDDGQEEHLLSLVNELNARMDQTLESMPRAGESLLFIATSLAIIDQIRDLQNEFNTKLEIAVNSELTHAVEEFTQKIETIAKKIEIY